MAYKPKILTSIEGGTGASNTATSGKVLIGDGTNFVASTPTFPTSAGTANNILASNGTNFISTTPSLVFLTSTTISGAPASVSFTSGLTTYSTLMVQIASLQPATNGTTLNMDVSSNAGSSYFATGYSAGINYSAHNSATLTNANSSTTAILASAINNASLVNCTVWLYQMGLSGSFYYHGTATWFNGSNIVFGYLGGQNTNNSINALRFSFSSGNMNNQGYIAIYGLAK